MLLLLWHLLLLWKNGYDSALTANPIEYVTHKTGDWIIRFLLITLCVTPLRKLLNQPKVTRYRRMLVAENTDKEVKDYVKERFRSAMQLMRNIAQRKSTILRTCEVIVRRQQDFLERGIEALRPMMIKEVAEEIGVHPSTVSRAVASKYADTPQGVFELRYFFSEAVQGSAGSATPLLILKRRVKKMIEEEDTQHPLTDEQITARLKSEGIDVTRRTVAKYREDMKIPSTHQRRVRN